jgi:hypothetical protein
MEPTTAPSAPTIDAPREASARLRKALELGAVGLGVVALLYLVFAIGAGIALANRTFVGDDLHRVGYVAASAVDLRIGLTVLVTAVLAAACAHLDDEDATTTRAAGVLTVTAAALTVLLAALAVRAQYHQLDLRHTTPTSAFHLSQATYVVGAMGPAVLAGVIAVRSVLGGGERR